MTTPTHLSRRRERSRRGATRVRVVPHQRIGSLRTTATFHRRDRRLCHALDQPAGPNRPPRTPVTHGAKSAPTPCRHLPSPPPAQSRCRQRNPWRSPLPTSLIRVAGTIAPPASSAEPHIGSLRISRIRPPRAAYRVVTHRPGLTSHAPYRVVARLPNSAARATYRAVARLPSSPPVPRIGSLRVSRVWRRTWHIA